MEQTVTSLTKNGIQLLSQIQQDKKDLIFQILQYELVNQKQQQPNSKDCFKVTISDGFSFIKSFFANDAAIELKEIKGGFFPIVLVNTAIVKEQQSKLTVIITKCKIIYAEVTDKIGEPMDFIAYRENGYMNSAGQQTIPAKYYSRSAGGLQNQQIQKQIPTNVNQQFNQLSIAQQQQQQNNYNQQFQGQSNQNQQNQMAQNQFQQQNQNNNFQKTQQNFNNNFNNANNNQNQNQAMNNKQQVQKKANPSIQQSNNFNQSGTNGSYQSIGELYPTMENWLIKARVISKSNVRNWNSGQKSGKVFSIDLIDAAGQEIQGSFFNETVDKFYENIHVGKVYEFGKGIIKTNNRNFNQKSPYTITFTENSWIKVQENDNSISINNFNFVPIMNIKNMEVGALLDVIGIIYEDSSVQVIKVKSGENKSKRTIHIFDQSSFKVDITFWGEQAERNDLLKNNILILKGVKIGEYQGQKNLQFNFSSQMFVNSTDIKQAIELKDWLQSQNTNEIELQQIGEQTTSRNHQLKTISQIEHETQGIDNQDAKVFSDIRAFLFSVKTDGTLYYLACPTEKCGRKAIKNEMTGDYSCQSCNNTFPQPNARYVCTVKLTDSTGSIWVTVFDAQGHELFGSDANIIREKRESGLEQEVSELMKVNQYKEFRFKLMSKLERYNDVTRVKHQVLKIMQDDIIQESKNMITSIDAYLNL